MKFARVSLALLLALVLSRPTFAAGDRIREFAKKQQSRVAYGAYAGGKKVGWTIREIKLGRYQGRDVLIKSEETSIRLLVMGNPYHIAITEKTVLSLVGDGRVEYAEHTKTLNKSKPVKTTAVRKGTSLVITSHANGRTHSRTVPLPKQSLREEMQFTAWLQGPRRKGDTFVAHSVDLDGGKVENQSINTFVKLETAPVDGVTARVAHLKVKSPEGLSEDLMTMKGILVLQVIGKMMLQREKESKAKAGVVVADPGFNIRVKKVLRSPRMIDRLVIQVTGLKRSDFPITHYQRILSEKNGVLTVELLHDFRDDSIRQPLTDKQRSQYLQATAAIQSDDPTIRNLARKIVGKETDPVKQAGLLQEWVFRNLKKTYAVSATTSLGVLENKAGKCTDHALLFVALARAVNIPAREVSGAMYVVDASGPMFGMHAWAEIHNGKRWVTVDPMGCEVYVDGAHFRFSSDDEPDGGSAMFQKTSIAIVRAESHASVLAAFGSAGMAHILSSIQNLGMLFKSVDKKVLDDREFQAELKRTLFLIDLNIRQMTALSKTDLTYLDAKCVAQFLAIYRSLKVEAATLKAFAAKRGENERKAFQQADKAARKLVAGISR